MTKKNNAIPSPWPTYPTHDAVGVRRKRASFDHQVGQPFNPPPSFARRIDGDRESTGNKIGPGIVGRLVKSRTRVRPSSANARVDGKPGAGFGKREIEEGTGSVIPRKMPVPSQAVAILRGVKRASKDSLEQVGHHGLSTHCRRTRILHFLPKAYETTKSRYRCVRFETYQV